MLYRLEELLNRLLAFFRKGSLDRELEADIATHLDLAIDENLRFGLSPEKARRQALMRFGGVQQAKEQHRDTRGLPALEILLK